MLDIIEAQIRLLETTDLHMQLTGYDYVLDNHTELGGMSKLSGCIAELRRDNIETILCDNGDFLEGSPLADLAMEIENMRDHPLICAMNHLNYDAIGLGNHEFDYGTTRLRSFMSALEAPVLCANVRISQREHFATPWTIVSRHLRCSDGQMREIKVGVIGFVTPLQAHWGQRRNDIPLITDDIVAAAMTHLPAMRRAGADIAVALAHTGIGPKRHVYGMENAGRPLTALRGIDVVFLGHTHDQFPSEKFGELPDVDLERGLINDTPTAMAGHLGEALGLIDLRLEFADDDWHIVDHTVRLIDVAASNTPPDPEFDRVLKEPLRPLHERTLHQLSEPLGQTTKSVNTFFSDIGFDPVNTLISRASVSGIKSGLKGTPFEDLPMIGASASFLAGGRQGSTNYLDLPPGSIKVKHLAAMCPFDNPVCAVLRRGWQIRDWLEDMSTYFVTVIPGDKDQPLLSDRFPAYHFDFLDGLDYEFDLSVPKSFLTSGTGRYGKSRVSKLQFAGTDVFDDDLFVVATSRYRALGGGLMGHVPAGDIIYQSQEGIRELVKQTLKEGYDWPMERSWSFAPMPETSTCFLSSATALDQSPISEVKATGRRVSGFAEFQLYL